MRLLDLLQLLLRLRAFFHAGGQQVEQGQLGVERLGGRHGDLRAAQQGQEKIGFFLGNGGVLIVDHGDDTDLVPEFFAHLVQDVDQVLGLPRLGDGHQHVARAQAVHVNGAEQVGVAGDDAQRGQVVEEIPGRKRRVVGCAGADEEYPAAARRSSAGTGPRPSSLKRMTLRFFFQMTIRSRVKRAG